MKKSDLEKRVKELERRVDEMEKRPLQWPWLPPTPIETPRQPEQPFWLRWEPPKEPYRITYTNNTAAPVTVAGGLGQ